MAINVVILAAGKGTRMKSAKPKVLHKIAGLPMLEHVVRTAESLEARKISIVFGHGGDQVKAYFKDHTNAEIIDWVEQKEQLGTGHAVHQAMPTVDVHDQVLILYGDVPLIKQETLMELLEKSLGGVGLLTVELSNPAGYGRILRDDEGAVVGIVEQKDASEKQLKITEVNTGILTMSASLLNQWLPKLGNSNSQGEYYLTDLIAMAFEDGVEIFTSQPKDAVEVEGVNDRRQLAIIERAYQRDAVESLLKQGVSFTDIDRADIRGKIEVGEDIEIDFNILLEGNVSLGSGVNIGPNCCIKNSTIGDNVIIKANSIIEDALIAANCEVGPFARIRPGTEMAKGAKVGNFVETKKSIIGEGSKVSHLTYIGDAIIGKNVNVGAGTITCNYDGVNKSQTTIGDGAFIGSNSSLVAPVSIGPGATIGAGSTIGKNTPDNKLTLTRSKQVTIEGWQRPTKKK
ncbi:MAG: bifunctional UDP-N-acetylglucosamine diphosphorylase/glucosamine-1-phosphate N-acetyltransferase GlmU [Pseudomonadales bacterium]|nr:bifunctional UDP-N-acetylglucosamine diphosphorylase/glucosamine-1-phosphate N-acetyltransferase GlmU [Pseudomonadales bacterium]